MGKEPHYKLALITGATSGIGEAFARLLSSKNIPIIITGRNLQKLNSLAKELKAETILADLLTDEGREKVVKVIKEKRPDLIVNNAGFGFYGEVTDQPLEDSLAIVKVNIEALLQFTAEGAKALKQNNEKGIILNISSAAAWPPMPLNAVYAGSKSFVYQFSRSMDYETRPYGIRVFASCPGVVSTEFSNRAMHSSNNENTKKRPSYQVMTAEYAADQMWLQLKKQQQTRIYNGFYRFVTFLGNYLLPEKFLANATRNSLAERLRNKK